MKPNNQIAIYQIENLLNGRCYIGGSTRVFHRKNCHLYDLSIHKHPSKVMQEDYDKYGKDVFQFSILEWVEKSNLIQAEQNWIDKLHPAYNTNIIAGNVIPPSARTPKAKRKISETIKELWKNPEYAEKHRHPRNWKDGIPNRKGVKLTQEQKEHLSKINSGKNNPNYGTHRTDEFKKILGEKVSKTYVGAISPEGNIFSPIVNMSKFCREHGLCVSNMIALMHGRIKTHRGWTKLEALTD